MDVSPFQDALHRHAQDRRLAFERVRAVAIRIGRADTSHGLTDIDARAVAAWRATWTSHPRKVDWNWSTIITAYRIRPTAFQIALWSDNTLCGLSVGRMSKRRRDGRRYTLSLHFMESNPDPWQPLRHRVAPLVFAAAEEYARVFGAVRLRLIEPLPHVLGLYARLGFDVVVERGRPLYCEREIAYAHSF